MQITNLIPVLCWGWHSVTGRRKNVAAKASSRRDAKNVGRRLTKRIDRLDARAENCDY